MVLHAFWIVALASSASIPAFSKRAPITLLSPFMKAMKSCTMRASMSTTAAMANTFRLTLLSPFPISLRPLEIFWKLTMASVAPMVTPRTPMIFSAPPILAAKSFSFCTPSRNTVRPFAPKLMTFWNVGMKN